MLIRILTSWRVRRILKSRPFAVAVMGLFCLTAAAAANARGKTVSVRDGETEKKIYTLQTEPEAILRLAGVELEEGDQYTFAGFNGNTAEIDVHRAVEVTVTYASESRTLKLANATAHEAVRTAGFVLSENDFLNVDPQTRVSDGMDILVSSVDYSYVKERERITYRLKTQYSADLAAGKVTEKPGREGIRENTYRVKTVNGTETEKILIKSEIIQDAVDALRIIGTKKAAAAKTPAKPASKAVTASAKVKTVSQLVPPAPIELDASGRPVKYKKLLTGKATAYSPADGHTTATGKAVRPGYIAVNPKIIPYGTKMYIRTPDGKYIYGYASAEDTGGFTKKGKILADLFFPSYSEAIAFGVRQIEIYILE